eukprot:TRINITY_DN3249_c0_g2_i1.p1 TRINITY_DN3249_c0_g2~~TRINITY_DN3249_c0_g2_i1.p1  ORF type:complete len:288 (-),score=45.49 TRINITY_DN3249_c0_g2_i1:143-1006(-)
MDSYVHLAWKNVLGFVCCESERISDRDAKVQQCAPSYLYDLNSSGVVSAEAKHSACELSADGADGSRLKERRVVEIVTEEGMTYKGHLKGTVFHGYASLTRADGSSYVGEFIDGRAHGAGRYMHADGSTYEGEWAEDEKSGEGTEVHADGSVYMGQFCGGIKNGDGAYTSVSGVILFQGQMQMDKMHGEGVYNFNDGRTYKGQWKCGHMCGEGIMDFPDGSQYRGGMVKDVRMGEGTFTFPNGQVFRGQWRDGKPHGVCAVIADGKTVEGNWVAGNCIESVDAQEPR